MIFLITVDAIESTKVGAEGLLTSTTINAESSATKIIKGFNI